MNLSFPYVHTSTVGHYIFLVKIAIRRRCIDLRMRFRSLHALVFTFARELHEVVGDGVFQERGLCGVGHKASWVLAAFRPGQSPPLVRTPIRLLILSSALHLFSSSSSPKGGKKEEEEKDEDDLLRCLPLLRAPRRGPLIALTWHGT